MGSLLRAHLNWCLKAFAVLLSIAVAALVDMEHFVINRREANCNQSEGMAVVHVQQCNNQWMGCRTFGDDCPSEEMLLAA
jgi:hypothetical protein